EGAKVALAKALVAFSLDDLEEDRADHRLGKNLQQKPLPGTGRAVDQDPVALQPREILAVPRHAAINRLVISVRDRHKRYGARLQRLDRRVDVGGGERDVLDSLAMVGFEVLRDLRFIVGALVDRDADPP